MLPASELSVCLFLTRLRFNKLKTTQSFIGPRLHSWENFEPFIVFLPVLYHVISLVLCLLSRYDRYGESDGGYTFVCAGNGEQEVEL